MPKEGKNLYLRKDGRWEGRFTKGRIDGKTRYGYVFGKTYDEAARKLAEARAKIASEERFAKTFESISSEWLEARKPELKPSSIAKYTNVLKLYIWPVFGQQDVSAISRSEVQDFSKNLLTSGGVKSSGLAPKTVNSTISVMKNVFAYAVREGNIPVADISDISVKQPQKLMRILSVPEQTRLSRYLCDNLSPCNLGILLCLYTGLRIGEICALKWEDISIIEQYLFVHKTMQRIQVNENSGKKTMIVIQTPKSDCSTRKIPIPDGINNLLISCRKESGAYLLTGYTHSFIEPRSMENRFKAVVNECEII